MDKIKKQIKTSKKEICELQNEIVVAHLKGAISSISNVYSTNDR